MDAWNEPQSPIGSPDTHINEEVVSRPSNQWRLHVAQIASQDDVNTINTWAEPENANGVTPNSVIDWNDEPPERNRERMRIRNYAQ